jgi:hypothetical protein
MLDHCREQVDETGYVVVIIGKRLRHRFADVSERRKMDD